MTHLPAIHRGDIFHFDGLPGASRTAGTAPAGHRPNLAATTAGVLVKVEAITWTGELHLVRGHRDPDTDALVFPDYHFAIGGQITFTEARALIAAGIWRRYRR